MRGAREPNIIHPHVAQAQHDDAGKRGEFKGYDDEVSPGGEPPNDEERGSNPSVSGPAEKAAHATKR